MLVGVPLWCARPGGPMKSPSNSTPGSVVSGNVALGVTTRRTFVGAVGAVLVGCGSGESDASGSQQSAAPNGGNGAPTGPSAPSPGPANLPTQSDGQPMGAAAEAGDQAPQPPSLESEATPSGAHPTPATASTPGSCTLYPEQTE